MPLLVESSNNSAVVLARAVDAQTFISRLNHLIGQVGLEQTRIFNPNGLDPVPPAMGVNYSTADDLVLWARWLITHHPELLEITRTPATPLFQADGQFHHEVRTTDELLVTEPWSPLIAGGKTGQAELAGKNLILILHSPGTRGYVVNVVLGSPDHFAEMRALTDWVEASYLL